VLWIISRQHSGPQYRLEVGILQKGAKNSYYYLGGGGASAVLIKGCGVPDKRHLQKSWYIKTTQKEDISLK
jgi:hypothetical protein